MRQGGQTSDTKSCYDETGSYLRLSINEFTVGERRDADWAADARATLESNPALVASVATLPRHGIVAGRLSVHCIRNLVQGIGRTVVRQRIAPFGRDAEIEIKAINASLH